MVQMQLMSVGVVENTEDHLMVLREAEGKRVLVIGIGPMEATSIALAVEGMETARPMTHDLTLAIIRRLQGELIRAIIHDLKDDTFIGQIDLQTEHGIFEIDCRSSDAVALAVRAGCPIYATDQVLEMASITADGEEPL